MPAELPSQRLHVSPRHHEAVQEHHRQAPAIGGKDASVDAAPGRYDLSRL